MSQSVQLPFDHINTQDGLAQSSVYTIFQDKTGYLWFGTQSGLNKYDGYQFTTYIHDPADTNSLSNNWVRAIAGSPDGKIWVGTRNGGLNLLHPRDGVFNRFNNDPDNPASISSDRITCLLTDRFGTLWIGTANGGLNRLEAGDSSFTRFQRQLENENGLQSNHITALREDAAGKLWIGTQRGLYRFGPESDQVKGYFPNPNSLRHPENAITAIFENAPGSFWIGTRQGVFQFDPETGQFRNRSRLAGGRVAGRISAIDGDSLGNLWIGTWNDGLTCYHDAEKSFANFQHNFLNENSLSSDRIQSIFTDRDGLLWIGTSEGGINKYSPHKNKFQHISARRDDPDGLNDNIIRAIYKSDGKTVWIGTQGGGVNKISLKDDWENYQVTHYAFNAPSGGGSSSAISDIVADVYGTLWVSSFSRGLASFEPSSGQFNFRRHSRDKPGGLSSNNIRSLLADSLGVLWIATNRGLNRLDPATGTVDVWKHSKKDDATISSNSVKVMLKDSGGTLWVGTDNGLNRIEFQEKETANSPIAKITRYLNEPGNTEKISDNEISYLYQNEADILWIGTIDGGLNRLSLSTGIFEAVTVQDGLASNSIYAILGDPEGNIWMSTNKGITRYNPDTKAVRNYGIEDGLQSNEFNLRTAFASNDGELYFGGINGFNVFCPLQVEDNPNIPAVAITSLKVLDAPVNYAAVAEQAFWELSHDENVFAIEFAALEYTAPRQNRYAYRLEGFDPDWIYTDQRRQATYTNLDPGEYTFRVKAANNDGVWNTEGTILNIHVKPPYWRTWWFYWLCALAIAAVAYLTLRARIRRASQQRTFLENKVRARTQALREEKNKVDQINLELAKLSLVAQKTDNAVVIADADFTVEWVNDAFIRITGFDLEELRIRDTNHLKDISGNEDIEAIIAEAIKTCKPQVYESHIKSKADKEIWLSCTLTPILDPQGDIYKFVVIDSDITERKLNEQALLKSKDELEQRVEERTVELSRTVDRLNQQIRERQKMEKALASEKESLAVTLRSIGDGVITTDIHGRILLVNPAAERMTGWSYSEAFGKRIEEVFRIRRTESSSPDESSVRVVLREERPVERANYRFLADREGRERLITENSAPILSAAQQLVGVVLVFHDQTEKHRIDEERLKTSKLESVGVLAGGLAHDFNNILTAILGNLSIALHNIPETDNVFDILKNTEKASLRASALTQQLLTFSRGGLPVKTVVAVGELIPETVDFILSGSNVRAEFTIQQELWPVEIDVGQINQVIHNLVINAMQAMPNGGVLNVRVQNIHQPTENGLKEGDYVKIAIEDHGVGIPESDIQKIFDPYFTTKQNGSGLGLASVYSILKNHGGRITVDSRLKEGTVFDIFIPASQKSLPPSPRENKGLFSGKGKILVMDDEAAIRIVLERMLNQLGFQVVLTADGEEAIACFREAKKDGDDFQLVIMDLIVPGGMGGKEAMAALKKIDPAVTGIVISGFSTDPVMADAQAYGFSGVLSKPFALPALSQLLKTVM